MRPRSNKKRWIVIITIVAVVVLLVAGFGIDSSMHSGRVSRRVEVAGVNVGGESETELRTAVARTADAYKNAYVKISSPKGDLDTTAASVGLTLDQPATVAAVLAIDHNDSALMKPVLWLRSLFQGRSAPLRFTVDQTTLVAGLKEIDAANRVAPTEPTITVTDQGFVTVPGVKGASLSPAEVATQLQQAAESGAMPIAITVGTRPMEPKYTDIDAKAVADKASEVTKTPLALNVGGKSATVTSKALRSWVKAGVGPNGLELQVDQAKMVADLPALVTGLGTPPVDASVQLVGTTPQIVDGQNGTKCCAPDSAARITNALVAGQTTVALDLEVVPPAHDRAWAEKLGITTEVASFTTNHAPGENRVVNIHKMADTVKGTIIEPGAEFSLNKRVGQRTKEKGYVPAPVIYEGTHDEDVGGGVSQFATTLFNAAFFGGLDFEAYQSHSQYISRYPYGREATVSWEKPDLVIKNTTPYGIMIDTSYTDTSLTVRLISTPFVKGEQTAQSEEPKGPCKRVTTERTRTYEDGHKDVDKVYAMYQNQDGVKCT
jgi:vancomycin resistance protein YoaR